MKLATGETYIHNGQLVEGTGAASIPNKCAVRTVWAIFAAAKSALDGTQPEFRHSPPKNDPYLYRAVLRLHLRSGVVPDEVAHRDHGIRSRLTIVWSAKPTALFLRDHPIRTSKVYIFISNSTTSTRVEPTTSGGSNMDRNGPSPRST